MNLLWLFQVIWGLTFLLCDSFSEITSLNTNVEYILPVKAWIIYSESAEGSVTKQSIISNVTNKIIENDTFSVRIEEMRNPLNVFNQNELYVVFPSKIIDGLSGFYLIEFTPKPHLKGEISYFELDYVHILKEKQIKLQMNVRTNTQLNPWFYYSQDPKIADFWGISEENEDKLQKTKLINAIRFANKFIDDIPKEYIDNEWHEEIVITIDPLFSKQGRTLYLGLNLLKSLDSAFSERGEFLNWSKKGISQNKVEEVVAKFSEINKIYSAKYYINIEFNERSIKVGTPMVACIEKTIALETDDSDFISGNITIGVHF